MSRESIKTAVRERDGYECVRCHMTNAVKVRPDPQVAPHHPEPAVTPAAYLFTNGNAAFTDEAGQQLPALQFHGWRGLHPFLKRYPAARVSLQGADPLDPELVPWLLDQIREPTGPSAPDPYAL